jgi:hypothetical protein
MAKLVEKSKKIRLVSAKKTIGGVREKMINILY